MTGASGGNRTAGLAFFSRSFGELSQTFVRDHVRALPPQRTFLISEEPPIEEFADRPSLVLEQPAHTRLSRFRKFLNASCRIRRFAYPHRLTRSNQRDITEYLRKHRIKKAFVEFGDFAIEVEPAITRAGADTYVYFHGFDVRILTWLGGYEAGLRAMLQRIEGAIVGSELMRNRLIELGCPEGRIAIIPCGVDISALQEEPQWHGGRILMVSRLIPWKGVDFALRSFAEVASKNSQATLEVIGTGPLLPRLQSMATEMGIADRVTFRGGLSHPETLSAIAASDMLIQHNVTLRKSGMETLGLSVLEAMARAKPVVVTRHGSFTETVTDGVTGFLVDERDTAAMAARVTELMAQPDRAIAMGKAARQSVIDRYAMAKSNTRLRTHLGMAEAEDEEGIETATAGTEL